MSQKEPLKLWTRAKRLKMKSEKAAKRYAREETRSKAVREFLLSFQLPIIQPVPETPRHQCVGCYLCVRLNGATGPPLHNEARPFAVTPPHQEDREARNKKAGSEKEKEGERGRIKNGGGAGEWERRAFDGGEALTAERGGGGRRRWTACPFQNRTD